MREKAQRKMDLNSVCVYLFLSVLNLSWTVKSAPRVRMNQCYTEDKSPQRCFPPFINAAFNIPVEATNTCGFMGPEEFCQQTGAAGATKSCDVCNPDDPQRSHPTRFLTDFHRLDNLTWWQSSTMLEDVQWPTSVNLTINLGKAFEITYVRLKFFSSRPESFAIYKRHSEDSEWKPFQFYSASCEETYNLTSRPVITEENEGEAVCKDDFSDISPLTGGSVAFSTLEGRPRAYEFEKSEVLQDWVTATDIRIVLNRINTFRDEVFGDPNVLRSYFYAISDFAIGGRCKCNGHGNECIRSEGREGRLICRCQHFTDGPDCERCLPFYNDLPWKRAVAGQVVECKACNCNGRSETCYFDEAQYRHTGHGGHCTSCSGNTGGPNCERCLEGYYRVQDADDCQPCYCHQLGSLSTQCDIYGRCYCKTGVTGDKCDQCQSEYYNLTETGCSPCACVIAGSLYNRAQCYPDSGSCICKEFVEGQNCDMCKAGYFNLQEDDPLGCMPCFCYGHSNQCSLSPSYSLNVIRTQFYEDTEKWTGATRFGDKVELEYYPSSQEISIASEDSDFAYFVFPDDYLGNQRFSYNQLLAFNLRIQDDGARPSAEDLVIEGNGLRVVAPIFAQGNQLPGPKSQEYGFRLSEHASYRWMPKLTSHEFVRMLSNLTSIKLRGTYINQGVGYLSDVNLLSAVERTSLEEPSGSVERCTCPEGYVGQFCESCEPGYHRDVVHGGPYALCVPCNCNGHSDVCDINTGKCICDHNTTGEHCEICLDGFYGFSMAGTPEDCQPCPCPAGARCVELISKEVACFDCPHGQTGHRCEFCHNGYYGDPLGRYGDPQPCRTCECNNNVDPNAVGNCNETTGECLRCIYNTAGDQCEHCLPGYYGNALSLPHGDCQACECFPLGSNLNGDSWDADNQKRIISCNNETGLCSCLPNVIGQHCNQCREGYWNIFSGTGCETCNCDRMGSVNGSCDVASGQCFCKEGVTGAKCHQCVPNYFGFSPEGCTKCNCDPDGSLSLQCEIVTGLCPCRPNVVGRYCDKCALNKYNISGGCIDCPVCYDTVKDSFDVIQTKLNELRVIIEAIKNTPPDALNDTDFLERMSEMNQTVHLLWIMAKNTSYSYFVEGYEDALSATEDTFAMAEEVSKEISHIKRHIHNAAFDASEAEAALNKTEMSLREAELLLSEDGLSALAEANERQEKMGQQSDNMTEMAQEARRNAERLEAETDAVIERAGKALNTSEEALHLMNDVIAKHEALPNSVRELEFQVNGTHILYEKTSKLAEQSRNLSTVTYDVSLAIYTEVNSLLIPNVDADGIQQETSEINATAVGLIQEVDDALEKQAQLVENIAYLKGNASELLADGQTQLDILQGLSTDAETAKDTATKAVEKANVILSEAQNTLITLKEFDQRVQDSRREAETALEKISEIQEYITDAENMTRSAVHKLGTAEDDAVAAQTLAETVHNSTLKALEDIVHIREEFTVVQSQQVILNFETIELTQNVTELEERLQQLEDQAEDDNRLIAETLQKADEAKRVAKESSQKVSTTLDEVNQMIVELDGQSSIDTNVLKFLEKYLDSAEKQLQSAGLDAQTDGLLQAKSQMETWVVSYRGELTVLNDDVENVRQINETLPRDCFKKIDLEPEAKIPSF